MGRPARGRKRRAAAAPKLSRKDKRHLVDFGEEHPANDQTSATNDRPTVVVPSEATKATDSEEESSQSEGSESDSDDAVCQLLGTFGGRRAPAAESDSESGDDDGERDGVDHDVDRPEDANKEDGAASEHSASEDEEQELPAQNDPFSVHYEWKIEDDKFPLEGVERTRSELRWPTLGQLRVTALKDNPRDVPLVRAQSQDGLWLKTTLAVPDTLTPLQMELLSVLSSYRDLLFTERSLDNGEEVRAAYCLHALNHVLKSRSRVLHHNKKLHRGASSEMRDQGLTRPLVLFLMPFRESALRTVKLLARLLPAKEVANMTRFLKEFGCEEEKRQWLERPEDYEQTFKGNTDDAFRIGLSVSGKTLRLYRDFYASDILIASPLGLRTVVGAEGEKDRDFDFLSSLEMVVVDQADVLLMQNWEHVVHLMEHVNRTPVDPHGADFSRVRLWWLHGWARRFRQTVVLSSVGQAPIAALLSRHAQNYAGLVATANPVASGSIAEVTVSLAQVFQRFDVASVAEVAEARFRFFTEKVLPPLLREGSQGSMVYVRSYFDFVRLRNHLRSLDASFCQICEYTTDAKVSRARGVFFTGRRRLLLYTERFHFYRRYRIKGVQRLVFYELPTLPHFYPELCRLVAPGAGGCTSLFCRLDALPLAAVVGSERAARLLHGARDVHVFVSGGQ
ncbi:U3 small nucleolar RNA-associated protein 25 homolog [Haemaphysalis longicornis]